MLILNPEKIALGGGVVENKHFNLSEIDKIIDEKYPNDLKRNCSIFKSSTGNDAALYGVSIHTKKMLNNKEI